MIDIDIKHYVTAYRILVPTSSAHAKEETEASIALDTLTSAAIYSLNGR